MRNYWIFTLSVFMFFACSSTSVNDETYASRQELKSSDADSVLSTTLKGVIENGSKKTLYLEYFEANKSELIDSVILKKKGQFEFEIDVKETNFYKISLSKTNYAFLILSPNQNVDFTADADSLNASYNVVGSEDSELLKEFFKYTASFNKEQLKLKAKADSLPQEDSPERREIQEKYSNNVKELGKYIGDFIKNNNSSPAALIALNYLKIDKDLPAFKMVAEGLKNTMPNSAYYKNLAANINAFEQEKAKRDEALKKQNMLAPGNVAPEIEMTNPEGEVLKLSSLRGKYVLIDFWASWCGPCRRENPNVVRVYNKYKEKGFEVFSVSLDSKRGKWLEAIDKDNLVWPYHVSDLKSWGNAAAKLYQVSSIPFTVLVDPEGKIIATKLRGQQLEAYLSKYLGD